MQESRTRFEPQVHQLRLKAAGQVFHRTSRVFRIPGPRSPRAHGTRHLEGGGAVSPPPESVTWIVKQRRVRQRAFGTFALHSQIVGARGATHLHGRFQSEDGSIMTSLPRRSGLFQLGSGASPTHRLRSVVLRRVLAATVAVVAFVVEARAALHHVEEHRHDLARDRSDRLRLAVAVALF